MVKAFRHLNLSPQHNIQKLIRVVLEHTFVINVKKM